MALPQNTGNTPVRSNQVPIAAYTVGLLRPSFKAMPCYPTISDAGRARVGWEVLDERLMRAEADDNFNHCGVVVELGSPVEAGDLAWISLNHEGDLGGLEAPEWGLARCTGPNTFADHNSGALIPPGRMPAAFGKVVERKWWWKEPSVAPSTNEPERHCEGDRVRSPRRVTVTDPEGIVVPGLFHASALMDQSMEPAYMAGRWVVFRSADAGAPGDVVLVEVEQGTRRGTGYITHSSLVIGRLGIDELGRRFVAADAPGFPTYTERGEDAEEYTGLSLWGIATAYVADVLD